MIGGTTCNHVRVSCTSNDTVLTALCKKDDSEQKKRKRRATRRDRVSASARPMLRRSLRTTGITLHLWGRGAYTVPTRSRRVLLLSLFLLTVILFANSCECISQQLDFPQFSYRPAPGNVVAAVFAGSHGSEVDVPGQYSALVELACRR